MLTRLRVSGFKNLVDVDVRFGPFTCIAGANGVGKSNLFDAIMFLSALADRPFLDAALSVRAEGGRYGDVRSLFTRIGDQYVNEMSFEAEMIVPAKGFDDLSQLARASTTFLKYSLTLRYRQDDELRPIEALELAREDLGYISMGEATKHLLFKPSTAWRKGALIGRRTSPFISTSDREPHNIEVHQEGRQGRNRRLLAKTLPRTVLSTTNAAENPTALLARRELQSWRLLQLEPSALRTPDELRNPPGLGTDGSHLPATVYHLARASTAVTEADADVSTLDMYGQLANRLADLIDDVREVWVDRDEQRRLLTLYLRDRDATAHPARALSDGTLRFLALAVLELDPAARGVLCLEEPENGIHPARIAAMLRLLQDIATDISRPVGSDNPLRQVIINTHSPAVVSQIPDDSLLLAELREVIMHGQRFKGVHFSHLKGTWRDTGDDADVVARGRLLDYLNPVEDSGSFTQAGYGRTPARGYHVPRGRRIVDREDLQPYLLNLPRIAE